MAKAPTVGALGEVQSTGKTQSTRFARGASLGMPFTRTAPKVGALGDVALANLGRSLRVSQEAAIPKAIAALMGQALCVVALS